MAKVKGIIVEIGGDTSKLQAALKEVNSSTSSLSKELKGVNSLLKLDPKNTELVSQKQEILKENIEKTSKKLEELKKVQEIADEKIANNGEISQENYRNLQREIINTQNKLHNLKAEASKWTIAGRNIEEFSNKVTNISNKIDKLGTTLTTRLTLPVAAIATGLINTAKNFETAFTGVEKTVDGTATQMANLKQGIKELAEEIPSSTTEIAAVAEAAGQLGIQTDNILGFSKAMIDLGNSTNLSADDAASQLAKFANITEMSQKDFDKLGSSIVDLGNNFATTEADIVNMAIRLAGAGHQVGMSEGQILGISAALSSVGIEAEMGGSTISKAIVKMQNAVEMGGDKLNSVLKKSGTTLRELELMSANDSKGFKELSQSIGMTSTEVKQLITAGTNLEDFASVSGMTAEQFKKAWKEDASGALTAFIKGLGDAESKGETAITMLSEMGLTEVRLRDSLLRAANAGDLFNNAIETGTKSWEENTALTNEANKRYQTLDSRMEITKNKIKNVALNTGNKLTPTFNKLLDKVDGLIDKFNGLNEEETKNIIKTAAIVSAIGPAIKIFGTFGKTLGTGMKTIGTFSQAMTLMGKTSTDAFKNASIGTQNLTQGLTFLTSPAGMATIAIGALAAGLTYLALKQTEAQKEAKILSEEMAKQKQETDQYNQSINEATNANLSQINSVSELKDELSTLVDENGKVKKGYESRVDFILKQLNEALGTEYNLNKDIIQSYKDLQSEIDATIEKKKAQIILESEEKKYTEAIQKQEEAVKKLKSVQDSLGMTLSDAKNKYSELNSKLDEYEMKGKIYNSNYINTGKEMQALRKLINAYEDAEYVVQTYTDNVKKYEDDYALYTEGKYAEIYNSILETTKNISETTTQELKKSIEEQQKNLLSYQEQVEKTGNKVSQTYATQAEQNLTQLIDELYNRTSTIKELGKDETEAWKQVAINSYDKYSEKMKQIPEETRKKIEGATNIVTSDIDLVLASGELAKKATVSFENNIEGENSGKNFVRGIKAGLTNAEEVRGVTDASSSLGRKILNKFKDVLGIHSPSLRAEEAAEYFLDGLLVGIDSNEEKVLNDIGRLASNINNELNGNLKFNDNDMRFPIVQDFGKIQGKLSNQIIDSTKTIFTTPQIVFNVQELDKAKLEQCFNYVNNKFGSKY